MKKKSTQQEQPSNEEIAFYRNCYALVSTRVKFVELNEARDKIKQYLSDLKKCINDNSLFEYNPDLIRDGFIADSVAMYLAMALSSCRPSIYRSSDQNTVEKVMQGYILKSDARIASLAKHWKQF